MSELPVPGRLNVALAVLAATVACALLWSVSHTDMLLLAVTGAVAFSFVNNTIFSLLHECVHGIFHTSPAVNTAFGRVMAAFFPTSYTLQRFFHLGHHRRNRSPAERFDYIAPGENAFLKRVQWYGILTGPYWLLPPLSCLIYLVAPGVFSSALIKGDDAEWSRQTGTEAMVSGVERLPPWRVRAEIVFTFAWQAAIFFLLDLTWSGWLLCYAAFAVNWSSLQYADHAFSPLDAKEGAWNLRVNRAVQWLFLNYHHHRVHHRNPAIPWIHLSRFVDPDEPRPSFLRVYLRMWRGPRPLPGDTR